MKRSVILVLTLLVLLTLPLYSFAEDTTPPDTTITSGPSGEIDYRDVTFEWTGSDNVTAASDLTYSFKLEGKDDSWSNWTYNTSKSYSDLRNGDYTFKVKARDEAGNVDSSPPKKTFTILVIEPGAKKWVFSTDSAARSSPAIGDDETVYIQFHAINPDGTKKWDFQWGYTLSSPAISADGVIYVGDPDSNLYAINPNGTEKWSFGTEDRIPSSPAISAEGTIFVGSDDSNLYAINPNGTEKWSFKTNYEVHSSPAIGADGTIYVGSDKLYAINQDGTEKWSFNTGRNIVASPAIGADGTIYVGSYDNNFYAINPDGTKKWSFDCDSVISSPAIGADGTIYVGSNNGKLYAIHPDGTRKWSFGTGARITSSPAIGADGTIYVGARGDANHGYLFAIYGESGGLADSSWPMFHHDRKHTGRTITHTQPPTTDFKYSPSTPLPNDTIQFTDQSSDPDGSIESWLWRFGDGSTSKEQNPDHKYSSTGEYQVKLMVVDDKGAADTKTKTVSVSTETTPPNPNPMTWASAPSALDPTTIEMQATSATDPEGNGVEYYFEETTGNSGGSDSNWQDSTAYTNSGLKSGKEYCYRVKARDKSDNQNETDWSNTKCAATHNQIPEAAFTYTPDNPYAEETITFDASSSTDSDGNIVQYEWDWDDDGNYEDSLTSPTIEHSFSDPGNYPVTLKVVDDDDASDTTTKTVTVQDSTPPAVITDFTASDNEDSQSTLFWTNPADSDLNEVVVRRKTSSFPTDNTDGDLVYEETSPTPDSSVSYTDTDITNSTTYYYAVFSKDISGNWNNTVEEGSNADTAKPLYEVSIDIDSSGWSMVSIPVKPGNGDPKAVFSKMNNPNMIFHWKPGLDSGNGDYLNPDTGYEQVDPLDGLWIHLEDTEAPKTFPVKGVHKSSQELTLAKAGWHQVGVQSNYVWNKLGVKQGVDGETMSVAEQADGPNAPHWISRFIWEYSPEIESTYTAYNADTSSFTMEPGKGYWVRTREDNVTLVIPYGSSSTSTSQDPHSEGIPMDSQQADKLDIPNPPAPPTTLSVGAFSIFATPNPLTDNDQVTFIAAGSNLESFQVKIYASSGKQIHASKKQSDHTYTWKPEGNMNNGLYLYQVTAQKSSGQTITETGKLLVLQ